MRFLLCLSFLSSFFTFAQFKPDSLGHVNDPAFKDFLKQNNIQLCGAFFPVMERRYDSFFARIVKDNTALFMDQSGKFYSSVTELTEALWIDEADYYNEEDAYIPEQQDGLVSRKGYSYDYRISGDFSENGKVGFNYNGKQILPAVYDGIDVQLYDNSPFIVVKLNVKQGVADTTGKLIIKPEFDYVRKCSDYKTLSYIVNNEGKEAVLDNTGAVTISFQSYRLSEINGYLEFSTKSENSGRSGIMDSTGKIIFQPVFRHILSPDTFRKTGQTTDVLVVVTGTDENEKYGLVDFKGNLLLDTIYDRISEFRKNMYTFRKGNSSAPSTKGIYNVRTKKVVLPAEYYLDEEFAADLLSISREVNGVKLYGLLNENGEVLIPANFNSVVPVPETRLFILESKGEFILADSTLKRVIPESFEKMELLQSDEFQNLPGNQFILKINGKYGTMSLSGNMIIPAEYSALDRDYYALVAMKEKTTYFLDAKGNLLANPQTTILSNSMGLFDALNTSGKRIYGDLYGNEIPWKDLQWQRESR